MVTIGQLNAAIYRNIQHMLGSKLSDMDIKNGQYDFFYVISMCEGISQKELSEHLHIGKSTTAKAVKNLIAKGYVRKEKDRSDNRLEHLYLTEAGKAKAPVVAAIFEENIKAAAAGLSEAEHNQLLQLMQRVLDNVVAENNRQSGKGAELE